MFGGNEIFAKQLLQVKKLQYEADGATLER